MLDLTPKLTLLTQGMGIKNLELFITIFLAVYCAYLAGKLTTFVWNFVSFYPRSFLGLSNVAWKPAQVSKTADKTSSF